MPVVLCAKLTHYHGVGVDAYGRWANTSPIFINATIFQFIEDEILRIKIVTMEENPSDTLKLNFVDLISTIAYHCD